MLDHGRTLAAPAAAAAGALIITGLVATPAMASHECVSDNEWQLVERSWTKTRVHRLFDVGGVRTYYSTYEHYRDEKRAYRACNDPGNTRMYITYVNYYAGHGAEMRVSSKAFERWR